MLRSTSKNHGSIRIGITQGELSGVSPEIIAKTLENFNDDKTIEIYVIGTAEGIIEIKSNLKTTISKHIFFEEIKKDNIPDQISNSPELSCVYQASKMALNGELDAIVTAPVDKNKTSKNYPKFSGHTGFLKELLKTKEVLMLMVTPSIKIGIMTEHKPVKDIAKHITKQRIIESVKLFHKYLKDTKIDPVIGVLALNPHAGDSGILGTEEIDIILPAINELKEQNIKVIGPVPADSAFISPTKDQFDGILAMYHDQGMIPAKIKGMDSLVNVTLGLPIIRTSPGHGVAYDIKGTGKASASSMIKAVNYAIDMVLAERISK